MLFDHSSKYNLKKHWPTGERAAKRTRTNHPHVAA